MNTQEMLDLLEESFPRKPGSEEEWEAREIIMTALADRLDLNVEEEGLFIPYAASAFATFGGLGLVGIIWLFPFAPAVFAVAALLLWCATAWELDGRPSIIFPSVGTDRPSANLVAKQLDEDVTRPLVLVLAPLDTPTGWLPPFPGEFMRSGKIVGLALLLIPVLVLGLSGTAPSTALQISLSAVTAVGAGLLFWYCRARPEAVDRAHHHCDLDFAISLAKALWNDGERPFDVRLVCTTAHYMGHIGAAHYAAQHGDEWFDRPLAVVGVEDLRNRAPTFAFKTGDLMSRPLLHPDCPGIHASRVPTSSVESFRKATKALMVVTGDVGQKFKNIDEIQMIIKECLCGEATGLSADK